MTFLDELYGIGTLTDPHLDEYDGDTFATPSLIDHDDGKEARSIGDHENPIPQA